MDAESELPSLLLAERSTGPVLAAINWSDAPRPASAIGHVALLPQRTWTDAWTSRCLITADLPKTELAPHACLLLT